MKETSDLPPALDGARRLLDGFGRHLAATRKHHSISVRALAEHTGIRPDILNRIEKGTWVPSADHERTLREWLLQHSQRPVQDGAAR